MGSQRAIEKALDGAFGRRITQECPAVERRTELSYEEFESNYRKNLKPVIVSNFIDQWPANRLWTFEYLKEKCRGIAVLANSYSAVPTTVKFEKLIDDVISFKATGAKASLSPYLQEWHFEADCPELMKDISILPTFANDWLKKELNYWSVKLWIGAEGSTSFLHQDNSSTHTWHVQLKGRKQWFFFSPKAHHISEAEVIDEDRILNDPSNQVQHCVLSPGDVLYIPKSWWHRVKTIEKSICVSTTFVDYKDVPAFVKSQMIFGVLGWLNQEKMKKHDPGMYYQALKRAEARAKIMGFDPNDILGFEKDMGFTTVTDAIRGRKAS